MKLHKNQFKAMLRKTWKRHRNAMPETPEDVTNLIAKIQLGTLNSLLYPPVTRNWTQCFLRARATSTLDANDRDDPQQHSHPPASMTSRGRANIPGYPAFYGGDDPRVVLLEIGAKKGDDVYVSCWKHPGPINYAQFCFSVSDEERIVRETQNADAVLRALLSDNLQPLARVAVKSVMEIFLDPKHGISSAIAHDALHSKNFDAIEFACASTKCSFNYALKPECAAKMTLWRVVRIIVGDGNSYHPQEVGEIAKGDSNITWKQVTEDMPDECTNLLDVSEPGIRELDPISL